MSSAHSTCELQILKKKSARFRFSHVTAERSRAMKARRGSMSAGCVSHKRTRSSRHAFPIGLTSWAWLRGNAATHAAPTLRKRHGNHVATHCSPTCNACRLFTGTPCCGTSWFLRALREIFPKVDPDGAHGHARLVRPQALLMVLHEVHAPLLHPERSLDPLRETPPDDPLAPPTVHALIRRENGDVQCAVDEEAPRAHWSTLRFPIRTWPHAVSIQSITAVRLPPHHCPQGSASDLLSFLSCVA